jgi:hypothetical protein
MGGFSDLGLHGLHLACLPDTRTLSRQPDGPVDALIGPGASAARRWGLGASHSRRRTFAALLATAALIGAGDTFAQIAARSSPPPDPAPTAANEDVLKKLELMEQRIRRLEGELKKKNDCAPAAAGRGTPASSAKPAKPAGTPDWVTATPPAKSETAQPEKPAAAGEPTCPPANAVVAAPAAKPSKPAAGAPDWTVDAPAAPSAPAVPSAPSWNGPGTAQNPGTAPNKPILGLTASPVAGLSIGAYGEMKYGFQQNPAAFGQWQNGFDAHRLVLLPTYQITDNIIFNAEIEFEHAGTGFDADDKLHGTAEIEQVWVDFKIVDPFNWRAPGIDLVPIGYINEHHEPTQFYSVRRPELYNGLIPSTWKAPATSVYGTIAEGWTYTIQASSSLEDFGGDFATRTDANTVPPFPIGYGAGIDGHTALAFSLPVRGDFRQLSNDIAGAIQISYSPPQLPGFSGSTSAYYTPNTTPRGAYANTGMLLGRSSLAMFDTEFRYRIPDTGWEARAEYVFAQFGNPANLRANNDGDPTNNVGKTMYGYSGELAYHLPLGNIINSEWELVPFYRYTYQNFQTAGFAGIDINAPTGAGQTQFHNAGIAVFPSPQIVLKATYQKVINRDPLGARADSVLGGVGFFF